MQLLLQVAPFLFLIATIAHFPTLFLQDEARKAIAGAFEASLTRSCSGLFGRSVALSLGIRSNCNPRALNAVMAPWRSYDTNVTDLVFAHTEIQAIQQLQKDSDPVNTKLYQLLEIFSTGSLADYKAFYVANEDVITNCGIDNDRALTSMRLLTLHRLALNQKVRVLDMS